ncbi:MAG: GGDEF domain-containing response regulator [Planctomycetota bacterium]
MRANARILVIGSPALSEAVAQAAPRCRSTSIAGLLNGLWTVGQHDFDGIVVSLGAGRNALRAIRSLREVAPAARIVLTCAAADEPHARAALEAGADDYVIEPPLPADLATALALSAPAAAPPAEPAPASAPSLQEVLGLSDILRKLGDDLPATLERLAALVRGALGAASVALAVGEHTASAGSAEPAVLEEPLRDGDTVLGRITLGRRSAGSYSAADAARLGDYARLIETILAQAREQAHWRELAWRDDLSGLRNRRYFDAALERLVRRGTTERLRLTVLLFDIDEFKSYNDRYGHETGDALVREVGLLLTRCSREADVVARYGGDEFTVLFWDAEQPRVPGSLHPTDAVAVAERFRSVIGAHAFQCLGSAAPGPVTLSGGLATFPWDGKTTVELMRAADAALLAAKRAGKNRIVLAGPSRLAADAAAGDSAESTS